MTPQNMHSVDEELVAAFVDGDVTAEERQRVEAAMASDEQVAWEVNTLRQTVELLQDLPAVPLPRSFVLTEDQVADVLLERRSRAIATAAPAAAAPAAADQDPQDSPWQRFLRFLNGGDLALRNAAALAAVLLVLFYVAEVQLQQNQVGSPDGSGDQLSQAPSTPQVQVTVVGGTLSPTDGAVADAPASDDSPVADAENGAAQEDGEAEFGVMSTGDQDQETVDSAEQPVAAEEVKPESGAAAEQVARTESSPASAPGTSGETQQSGSENVDDSNQSLLTVFRYARILLVLAVIAFWLFSRIRSRGSRA
jgi:anti-sigma factor RsiW